MEKANILSTFEDAMEYLVQESKAFAWTTCLHVGRLGRKALKFIEAQVGKEFLSLER